MLWALPRLMLLALFALVAVWLFMLVAAALWVFRMARDREAARIDRWWEHPL